MVAYEIPLSQRRLYVNSGKTVKEAYIIELKELISKIDAVGGDFDD